MDIKLGEPPNPKQVLFLRDTHRYICYGGAKGGGKATCLDEPVLTPFGFRPMGNIKVGSTVCTPNGGTAKVIQIHPQGVVPIYEVEFIDGAKTRCTADHLWYAKRTATDTGWKVYTTSMLMDYLSRDINSNVLIPLCGECTFTFGRSGGAIKPYTLGVMLGDGCLSGKSVSVTTIDQKIIDNINADGYTTNIHKGDRKAVSFYIDIGDDGRKYLISHDLKHTAEYKYIPDGYKNDTVENRYEILRGLLDTDGTADPRGHISYCTISQQLAKDVQYIVWSLGGKATITTKNPHYRHNGELRQGKLAYIVYIQMPDNSKCFKLKRKKDRCAGKQFNGGASELCRRLKSIKPCGEAECQCITLDSPQGLYITKDFIVTHNSWSLRTKAILLAGRYDGIKILILRRTYPEIRNNHILPMLSTLNGVAKYNEQQKSFAFPNGSRIFFGYCDSDADAARYQGQEYDILMLDEATSLMEEWWEMVKLCVRGVNGLPKRTYLTCNPGNVGHEWVKRLFIDREFRDGEDPNDYTFIPAKVYDNTTLMRTMPEYVRALEALPPEKRAALLDGSWDSFEGRFFPEFTRDTHVIEPFPIPAHWRKYRALDYGLDMLACLWIAVDEQGYEYVYRELHQPNMIAAEAARKIVEYTGDEEIYATFAPPDLWARSKESAKTVAELFRENGVDFTQADNNRINGWQQVKDHIKLLPDLLQPIKDKPTRDDIMYAASPNYIDSRERARIAREQEAKKPTVSRLRVFSTCPVLIKHMGLLQYDDKIIGDASTDPHIVTHICISGDTLIRTVDGNIPIQELVGKSGECYSWDGIKPVIRGFDSACMTAENAEVYEVELDNGIKIKATANHRVMTAAGWKEICELTGDDDIIIAPFES